MLSLLAIYQSHCQRRLIPCFLSMDDESFRREPTQRGGKIGKKADVITRAALFAVFRFLYETATRGSWRDPKVLSHLILHKPPY